MTELTLTLADFEAQGITKETLARYVTIKTGIIPEDVMTLSWRAIVIRRTGSVLLATDLRPEATCFKFYLHRLESVPTIDELKVYAARVVKHAIALEDSCVRSSVNAVRNAFKAHGKTSFQFDQQVVSVRGRYVKVYKEPRYTKLHEDEQWQQVDGFDTNTWIEKFIFGTYPKDVAEAMLDHIFVLKTSYECDNEIPEAQLYIQRMINDAGVIVRLAIGYKDQPCYILTYYGCDFVNKELEPSFVLKSLIESFL